VQRVLSVNDHIFALFAAVDAAAQAGFQFIALVMLLAVVQREILTEGLRLDVGFKFVWRAGVQQHHRAYRVARKFCGKRAIHHVHPADFVGRHHIPARRKVIAVAQQIGQQHAVGRDGEDRLCAGRVRDGDSGKDIQPKRMSEVRAKKALGQHFLVDLNIARKICDSLGGGTSEKPCPVLEVGCGMGVLTRFLLKRTDVVTYGAEIDSESVAYLHAHYPEFTPRLMEGDFLKMDLRTLFPEGLRVIGNFPYNISSQIFFKVLENRDLIPECVGMIQKEVAVRLAEPPGSKEYGILSVLLQAWYDIEYLFTVNETVFNPPPKVNKKTKKKNQPER
jgi:ribosomal RNA small subunit methyltransferase A